MTTSYSDALVIFGVSGDLARKMIFPALFAMTKRGVRKVPVIGVAFP
jgi:glucose-6-phosphate 1-dehydrogenase